MGDFANRFGTLPFVLFALIEDKAKIDAKRMMSLTFNISRRLAKESLNNLLDVVCSSKLQEDFLKR